MTRQDLQGVVDYAKNRIIERLVTKYDVQRASESASDRIINDLQTLRRENQPVIRQTLVLSEQTFRRMQALETRIVGLEQDIKDMTRLINQVAGQQNRTTSNLQRY